MTEAEKMSQRIADERACKTSKSAIAEDERQYRGRHDRGGLRSGHAFPCGEASGQAAKSDIK